MFLSSALEDHFRNRNTVESHDGFSYISTELPLLQVMAVAAVVHSVSCLGFLYFDILPLQVAAVAVHFVSCLGL